MNSSFGTPYLPRRRARICLCLIVAAPSLGARAQNPLERYPQNYKLVFDNPQISVIRVHYGPHENVPVHDHSDFPTLFVYLNNSGPVRFRQEGVPPSNWVRPATKLGSFRYSPGGVERHSVQNLSDQPSEFLRIELKQFPLKGGTAFRRDPPADLTGNSNVKEFSNDEVDVERVVCAPHQQCAIAPGSEPSLLVALSDIHLDGASLANDQKLESGEIKWVEAHQAISISAAGSAPAHLVRVLIKSPRPTAPLS